MGNDRGTAKHLRPFVQQALADYPFFENEGIDQLVKVAVDSWILGSGAEKKASPKVYQHIKSEYKPVKLVALTTVISRARFLEFCADQMKILKVGDGKLFPFAEVRFCHYCPPERAGQTLFIETERLEKHPLLDCTQPGCTGFFGALTKRQIGDNKLSSILPIRLDLDGQLGRMSPLMKSFPVRLWAEYMHRHFPLTEAPAVVTMGPRDIQYVFEDIERKYRPEYGFDDFEEYGRDHDAAYWLDDCLMEMAFCGDIEPLLKLTLGCRDELWLRAKYALHAIESGLFDAEEHQSEMPAHAPDKIKHFALLLCALAGPAKDIPDDFKAW